MAEQTYGLLNAFPDGVIISRNYEYSLKIDEIIGNSRLLTSIIF